MPGSTSNGGVHSDAPQAITPTVDDLASNRFSAETLCHALSALTQDGVVLLKSVIDVSHINALNARMCADADKILEDPDKVYNHGIKSNFLQRPPVDDETLLFEDVWFNPFVIQLANAYLGQTPIFNWLTSNTALANTSAIRQPVHKDNAYIHPQFPYYFIANIPLTDFSIANGATEFWLGSHASTSYRDQEIGTEADKGPYAFAQVGQPIPTVRAEAVEARRQVRPPLQPECQKGDIMIRDLRTWHAGMGNGSAEHRIMLGLGYMVSRLSGTSSADESEQQSPHYPNETQRCHLPERQAAFWGRKREGLEVRANLLEDEEFRTTNRDADFNLRPMYAR